MFLIAPVFLYLFRRFFWKYIVAGFWNNSVDVEYPELFCSVDIGSLFFISTSPDIIVMDRL